MRRELVKFDHDMDLSALFNVYELAPSSEQYSMWNCHAPMISDNCTEDLTKSFDTFAPKSISQVNQGRQIRNIQLWYDYGLHLVLFWHHFLSSSLD